MRLALAMTAVALALLGPTAAAAQDAQGEARALFQLGTEAYDAERYEDALTAFTKADSLSPSWKLAYNIGQCQAALKRYGLALEAFERYLALGGDDVPADRRDEVLAELDRLRKMVGGVLVEGRDGAVLLVDGLERGRTPMNQPVLVTAGVEHRFEIRLGDELLEALTETVRGGATLEIDITPETAPVPAPVPSTPDEPAADAGGLSPLWFWIGAGATVVFAGGTVAANFAVEKKKRDGIESGSDLDSAETIQALGITSLALAGAAGIATGVLAFYTDWGGGEEQPAADVQIGAFGGGDGAGLAVRGSF
jgi:tetratricopeptide (TPR) repeat protein